MIILGAGLAGLLAGALDRRARLLERQRLLPHNHGAVLRFRTGKIGEALNIPFRCVRVSKAICVEGRMVPPAPLYSNWYSRKCTGAVVERSIDSIDRVERFVAPADFTVQLAELCAGRTEYGREVTAEELAHLARPLISTIPLDITLQLLGRASANLQRSPIHTLRYRIGGGDVFQTIYFPHPEQPVYRASITANELLIECVGRTALRAFELHEVLEAFGLRPQDADYCGDTQQQYGKITELPTPERKALIGALTREHGIWSLGRYANWRNVLLDDVFNDFYRIRDMMKLTGYDLLRAQA